MGTRVLVVDDDPTVSNVVSAYLTKAGYEAKVVADGVAAVETWQQWRPSVVVLDVMLPGLSGLEVLRRLRAAADSAAVIMLSARGDEEDRLVGLEVGADDYVVKPFSARELLARVEAVLRRSASRPEATGGLDFPGGSVDFARRELSLADGSVKQLSEKEQQILSYLAGAPDRAVPREELLERVWGLDPRGLETRTVDMHVARLREKMGTSDGAIVTVRGRGYMLAPDVKRRSR